ncbi:hypothetical protein FA95DRAFT_306956 [Auriscalpium vulgare]|uniref:Uncharacterized protein n=1 Tax=Auriscalpium vulgare TaxID=40419 RepID=A0ACB8RIL2_9AGAM|nr:hypothetical protein FA95DRAFT_306956 [Auriscalpium vulgare]
MCWQAHMYMLLFAYVCFCLSPPSPATEHRSARPAGLESHRSKIRAALKEVGATVCQCYFGTRRPALADSHSIVP